MRVEQPNLEIFQTNFIQQILETSNSERAHSVLFHLIIMNSTRQNEIIQPTLKCCNLLRTKQMIIRRHNNPQIVTY